MAFQQGQTLSFRSEMVLGGQNFASDTFYMALYTAFATLGPTTTEYTAENEVSSDGTNYTAGGNVLTGATVNIDVVTNTVYVNFDNVSWPDANFTARGALIYNSTQGNKSVAVLDFGSDKTFNAVSNTVTMPVNSATTALLRFV
jgi:hypothetical protein